MSPKIVACSRRSEALSGQNTDVASLRAPPDLVAVAGAPSADARLGIALEEKSRLELALQTVRHSVGNQLALLSAMLARQARTSGDPSVQRELKTAQRRVHAVAETLRLDGLREDAEFVSARLLVQRAIVGLTELAAGAEIKIEVEVQELALQRDEAISFMLIINELAVNCLKHAFPVNATGEIRIRFAEVSDAAGHFLALTVEDNGIGRTREGAEAGLGTTVILAAVQSLGAKLVEEHRWKDRARRGLRITILKPLLKLADP